MNQKGDAEVFVVGILITICLLLFFVLLPVTVHQNVKRTQKIMAKTGVEMSYWDIFWTDPEIRYTQGKIIVEKE